MRLVTFQILGDASADPHIGALDLEAGRIVDFSATDANIPGDMNGLIDLGENGLEMAGRPSRASAMMRKWMRQRCTSWRRSRSQGATCWRWGAITTNTPRSFTIPGLMPPPAPRQCRSSR